MRHIRRQNNNLNFVVIFPLFISLYIIYLLINSRGIVNVTNILVDSSLFIFSFLAFLFFFSIFIFPAKEIKDFSPIIKRVFLFMTERHGPISQVNNGIKVEKHGGFIKSNPGLILVDSSSAAIIRRTTSYHRTVGPGIIFTRKNEIIADTVDLQMQKKFIGPLEGENPFSTRQKYEKTESYLSRIQRAEETKAVTRDGIEIIATLSLTFKLKSNPGEGKSPFGYNPLSVERAILGQIVDLNTVRKGPIMSWASIPGLLTVDIWRELIHKYKLSELFQENGSLFDYCIKNIQSRLTQPKNEEIDEYGKLTGNQTQSREFQFLEDRGIDFLEIQLRQLFLPQEIENGLIHQWESAMLKISIEEKTILSRLRDQATSDGKQSGKKFIVDMTSQIINKLSAEGLLTSKNLINHSISNYENISKSGSEFINSQMENDERDFS